MSDLSCLSDSQQMERERESGEEGEREHEQARERERVGGGEEDGGCPCYVCERVRKE